MWKSWKNDNREVLTIFLNFAQKTASEDISEISLSKTVLAFEIVKLSTILPSPLLYQTLIKGK